MTKPAALIADAIRDASRRGERILDPFAGSGTLLVACEQAGRIARAMELDPLYVDLALRRWEAFTGGQARHAGTGCSFTEMNRLRAPGPRLLPAPQTAGGGA